MTPQEQLKIRQSEYILARAAYDNEEFNDNPCIPLLLKVEAEIKLQQLQTIEKHVYGEVHTVWSEK